MCGRVLPITEYAVNRIRNKSGVSVTLQGYCKACHNTRRNRYTTRPPVEPEPEPIIPFLKVGKRYVITDTGRTWIGMFGGDSHKPVHYVGPCVARWGRNWGIRTSTGIRCFTPSTLVGLDVREVGKSA